MGFPSSIHGIFQQEYWSGLPFSSPGDLPDPGIEPRSPKLQADCLMCEPPGKPRRRNVPQHCCSVAQSYPTLCNPMDCSTPVFPVLHHLLELAQTHVHWVGDAIQLSCPLSFWNLTAVPFPGWEKSRVLNVHCYKNGSYIKPRCSKTVLLSKILFTIVVCKIWSL